MKITDFQELWEAVRQLTDREGSLTPMREFITKGLDTDLTDVYETDVGELISVQGSAIRKIIVHICDITEGYYSRNEGEFPKFHILKCEKLQEIWDKKKHRFKKTGRDDGQFWLLTVEQPDGLYKKLYLCGYCRNKYQEIYGNYFEDIPKYLQQPIRHIQPCDAPADMTTIPGGYTKDWAKISRQMREEAGWKCQKCRVDLGDKEWRRFLHVHHENGDKQNNIHSNLKVLCIRCHAEEPQHSHMKNKDDYKEYMSMPSQKYAS